MLKPKKEILQYVKDTCDFPCELTADDMETILFNCVKWDMEFYIEELIAAAGTGDSSMNISYYDYNAGCICLIWGVDYEEHYDTAEEVVNRILWWQNKVNYFKGKFLQLKE